MTLALRNDSVIPSAAEESIKNSPQSGSTLIMPRGHGFVVAMRRESMILVIATVLPDSGDIVGADNIEFDSPRRIATTVFF